MVTTVLSITLLNQISGKHFLVETQDKPAEEENKDLDEDKPLEEHEEYKDIDEEYDDTAYYDNNVVDNEVDAGTVEIKGLIH